MQCSFPASAVIVLISNLLTSSSLWAQSTTLSPKTADKNCVVAGRVVTAANASPLKSARVALLPEDSHSVRHLSATTSDSDGRFAFEDIVAGRYRFFASRAGFVDEYYKATSHGDEVILSLKDGEKVKGVLFRMTRAAVITGRVSNEDGESMVGVQVAALGQPDEEDLDDESSSTAPMRLLQPVSSAKTDDRGQYRIFGLEPGEYYVRADDSSSFSEIGDDSSLVREVVGSEYASVFYPGLSQVSQAQVIPVRAGDEVEADLVMHRVKTVEIAGRVVDLTGPSGYTSVSLEPVDDIASDFDRHDITDENGHFRLRNIPEGSYFITVSKGHEQGAIYARQKVEVAGENIELIIPLGIGATIQGRVNANGLKALTTDRINIDLSPVDDDGLPARRGVVRKDGTFEIKGVHDGNYAVSVWGLERSTYVQSIRHGSDDVLEKGLQVGGESSGGKLEVTISSDGAQLEGTIADDEGVVVIGAEACLDPDPMTPYNRFRRFRITTDQTGHFVLPDLAPGKYRVYARFLSSSASRHHSSEAQPVTLSQGDRKAIQVRLAKTGQ
jgi:Carboxypeptidase regulatory-like domain